MNEGSYENNKDQENKKKNAQDGGPSDWALVAIFGMICLTTCFVIYTLLGR